MRQSAGWEGRDVVVSRNDEERKFQRPEERRGCAMLALVALVRQIAADNEK